MNTALARRLALGDRVIWMGKDDCQPSGPGTIIRITAHQVEVLWEGETARHYRRAQLYNLRHAKLISAAAEPRCGLAAQRPVCRKHLTQITAVLALTANSSAASRREAPLSTSAITRSRISPE
jgi:hypothetical protein